ncbi:MAG: efflux RND transporter periplasmic adaptor subunit [Magnetococcales bacterium]|nr:efflux RND transporter periplasmic adaptor subunit [Magnetococcales bacterium]
MSGDRALQGKGWGIVWFVWGFLGCAAPVQADGNGEGWSARVLLAAGRETVLSSRIPGRVEKLAVKEGDSVRQGQLLASMDCAIHEARRARVEAELKAARFKLEVQRRLEKLKSGSSLESDVAGADVTKYEAELSEARATVAMCPVAAPFDGRITGVKVGLHQSVSQGVPLVEMLDEASLEARLIVPSRWLAWLKTGMAFTLRLDETGLDYTARVVRIGARIDPASQSLGIVGAIEGKREGLLAGMSGMAHFNGPASGS